jgi:hypothetical protein
MDPNEALRFILAYETGKGSADRAAEAADGLADWLQRGGFKPDAVLVRRWDAAMDKSPLTPRFLRAYAKRLFDREIGVDGLGDDDDYDQEGAPWVSFTYGVLPPTDVFYRQFTRLVSDGKKYHYTMKGSDRELFDSLGLNPGPTTVSATELWDIVVDLHEAYDQEGGDDVAGDIVSAIFQTLHIEWI